MSHKLHAPGSRTVGYQFPARSHPLRVDDHFAPPETRVEYLNGREIFAAPANAPHADRHSDLAYTLRAHVTRNHIVSVDLLMRASEGTDAAPDASVRPAGKDSKTGGRKVEELVFEIADRQSIGVPTEKARAFAARGVRRVFCILVKQSRVLEWSREIDGWSTLPKGHGIDDACFVRPLPVEALLDATAADDAVARALLERGEGPLEQALQERRQEGLEEGRQEGLEEGRQEGLEEGRAEGEAAGLRRAVESVAEVLGISISKARRASLAKMRARDLERLRRALVRERRWPR